MAGANAVVTALSSSLLRFAAFVFFRWIPGHNFPPIITGLAVAYAIGFANAIGSTAAYRVVSDEVDFEIVSKPTANGHSPVGNGSVFPPETPVDDELVKEIEVEETIFLEEQEPHIFRTLLTGLPSDSSLLWSFATFAINLVLVLMTLDLTYRSTLFYPAHDLAFARVGYVSDTSAKIFMREPDPAKLPIILSYRYADRPLSNLEHPAFSTAWRVAGLVPWLHEETDYTTTLKISDLHPDTRYQYATSNNKTGFFITAPSDGHVSERQHAQGKFTFLHTSCLTAHFPYNPFDHPLSIPGLKFLSRWLVKLKPAFMLFVGDFIYIDVPRRHGSDVETYRREYRQVYASPDWASVSSTRGPEPLFLPDSENFDIPWIHTYDDHEVANDWDRNTTGVFPAAFDPYRHYHVAANPPPYPLNTLEKSFLSGHNPLGSFPASQKTYTTFTHGPASFFVLDTRRYRTPPNLANASDATRSMLGTTQLADVLHWIYSPPSAPGVRWKILASSVPFTKNWRVNAFDTWAGYLHERRIILEAMWDALATRNIGIVIVSGDRHEFACTAFPPPEGSKWARQRMGAVGRGGLGAAGPLGEATTNVPVEFSVSPLNMFYLPFHTYAQKDDEDVCIKYAPQGNSKFGAVQIGKEAWSGKSVLSYRLFVDGKETWSHELAV